MSEKRRYTVRRIDTDEKHMVVANHVSHAIQSAISQLYDEDEAENSSIHVEVLKIEEQKLHWVECEEE